MAQRSSQQAQSEESPTYPGKPETLYYRFMTPEWMKSGFFNPSPEKPEFQVQPTSASNDIELYIPSDSQDFERVFKLRLVDNAQLPRDQQLTRSSDITVRYRVGLRYTGLQPPDPLSVLISDGDFAFGFQIIDRNTYHTNGPYYPIQGEPWATFDSGHPTIKTDEKIPTSETNWPHVFDITLKATERFGTIFTPLDGGHLIVSSFGRAVDPSRGLWLELYRGDSKENYAIQFVEATVTLTY